MRLEVIIPWRSGCEQRAKALAWVLRQWGSSVKVTVAEHTGGPWVKALAVTPAVQASDAEIVVIFDADVWCENTITAVSAVEDGAPWALPHLMVNRLDARSTRAVLAGGIPEQGNLEKQHVGHPGGGIVALPRSTYLETPLDPRFTGWGQEDDAWALALTTLAGEPWRGTSPLWHLWHPAQPRMNRLYGSTSSRALYHRYERRVDAPRRMRLLVDEARKAVPA